ncbi:MAG: hypothetical protein IPH12_15060 [Saprospirales bacterium]|jgi:hypothetical protein|nr:hypothetical protein [Saprospirales bacterium]
MWITGLALLALAGCSAPKDEEPDIVVTLDPEFTVDLYRQHAAADGTPTFGLWVESNQVFDCSNYRIKSTVQLRPGAIDVQLDGIGAPDTCLGGPAPAKGFVPIGALADGTYAFTLALNPVIRSEGTLSVYNGRYDLHLPRQQGIDFQNRLLESVPAGYLWGFARTPSEQDQPVADQFIQELKSITGEPALPAGYYGYFTVSGAGQYFFHRSVAPAGAHKPFLRRLSGPADAIRALLQGYRHNTGHPLDIRCYSTKGVL